MPGSDDAVRSAEIMSTSVLSVTPDTPVAEVATLLAEKGISGVPVLDEDGAPVGVVSELDVITRQGATAGEIMSSGVISVTEDTPAEDIIEIFGSRRVRRVPVLSHGRIVGIISRSDLVRLFSLTRWTCTSCGYFERGFQRPSRCSQCGSQTFTLDRDPPGM
jgi:CBS domain-containing protein